MMRPQAPGRLQGSLASRERLAHAVSLERRRARMAHWLFGLAVGLALSVQAEETKPAPKPVDLTELSLDQLMNLDVPKVYAASKVEQKTTEAPSSVTIIT